MASGPNVVTPASAGNGPATLSIRRARLRDLPAIARLYRGQSPESRALHHPYPFGRARLVSVLFVVLASNRLVRTVLRIAPNFAFVVLIAEERAGAEPLGYGTIRFVRERGGSPWAQFGYLVREGYRGRHIGSRIAIELYRTSVALGVHRGGGTVLADNVASARIVERYGFHLAPTDRPDPNAPGRPNLGAIEDLDVVLERIRRIEEGGPPAADATTAG